jgi:hypothetical protein
MKDVVFWNVTPCGDDYFRRSKSYEICRGEDIEIRIFNRSF